MTEMEARKMRAKDLMTPNVATVAPDISVAAIAALLLERHISAVPVVAADGGVLGIVSEGDLMRRVETETGSSRSWWLKLFSDGREMAREYTKTHARRADEVMTPNPITVDEETTAAEIAGLLEKNRIKRVPVLRDGKIVGIVSRANLLQGLAALRDQALPTPGEGDQSIRDQIRAELRKESWADAATLNVLVNDGVVEIWGLVESDDQKRALGVLAENIAGVKRVELHVAHRHPW